MRRGAGIARVLITERGGTAVIGGEGQVVDRAITRMELIEQAEHRERGDLDAEHVAATQA